MITRKILPVIGELGGLRFVVAFRKKTESIVVQFGDFAKVERSTKTLALDDKARAEFVQYVVDLFAANVPASVHYDFESHDREMVVGVMEHAIDLQLMSAY